MRKGTKIFILLLSLFICWLILMNLGEIKASEQELAVASGIYILSCLPILLYFMRSEKNIPYLPIFGLFYFIYYGFSIFNSYDLFLFENIPPAIIINTLTIALLGIFFLMIAFYTPLGKISDLAVIPIKVELDYRKAARLGKVIGLFGLAVMLLRAFKWLPFEYPGLENFLSDLSRLGIAILFLVQLEHRLKLYEKFFLWGVLFLPRVLLDVSSGFAFPLIFDFVLLGAIYFYKRQTLPIIPIVIAGALVFSFLSVKNDFRALTWGNDYGIGEKISLYGELLSDKFAGKNVEHDLTYKQLSARSDYLLTFVKVVQLTPAYIPYWDGYTYSTLPTSFIPRFLFPGKPKKGLGQEFGHRYMFLEEKDITTSYNLPILIEMYINFSTMGVILGMFIVGLIFRFFYNLINHPKAGDGGMLISVMVFLNLLNIETDFSLIFGNVIQYIILFYLIVKMMRVKVEREAKAVGGRMNK